MIFEQMEQLETLTAKLTELQKEYGVLIQTKINNEIESSAQAYKEYFRAHGFEIQEDASHKNIRASKGSATFNLEIKESMIGVVARFDFTTNQSAIGNHWIVINSTTKSSSTAYRAPTTAEEKYKVEIDHKTKMIEEEKKRIEAVGTKYFTFSYFRESENYSSSAQKFASMKEVLENILG